MRCDTLAHLNAGRSFDHGTYTRRECCTNNASNELLAFSVGPKKTVKGNSYAGGEEVRLQCKSAARNVSWNFMRVRASALDFSRTSCGSLEYLAPISYSVPSAPLSPRCWENILRILRRNAFLDRQSRRSLGEL